MRSEAIINFQRKTGINWMTCITIAIFHAGAVAAFFIFSWPALIACLLLWWVSGSLGIDMGYHRLLTHHGYRTPKAVEYFLTICGMLALLAVGGFPMLVWGIFLRVTAGLHATWLVNSATHLWSTRRFETRDDSRNSWWVALLSFGEGWHNNHHAHPSVARHGLTWYEGDVNWWGIRALGLLGLGKGVKSISVAAVAKEADSSRAQLQRAV